MGCSHHTPYYMHFDHKIYFLTRILYIVTTDDDKLFVHWHFPLDFRAYKEALSKGACDVKYGRVLLLGAAEAGKTSLTHSLMNEPFQEDEERTIVADVHTVKPVRRTWAKAGKSYWESVNKEDEIKELAQLMAVVKPHEELAKTAKSLTAVKLFSPADAPPIQQVVDTKE